MSDAALKWAEAIGLAKTWPSVPIDDNSRALLVRAKWAQAYLSAGETLFNTGTYADEFCFYAGPMVQSIGLATELTLKLLLLGAGKTEQEVKRYGHSTYDCYFDARDSFDELKFLELVVVNLVHRETPQEILEQLRDNNPERSTMEWRVYFQQLRALDATYDRPFLNRYIKPTNLVLPDVEIILVGTKLLLSASLERLDLLRKMTPRSN